MEGCPVYSGLPVVHCGSRHNWLEDMVGVDVVVGVEESHAQVLLLVRACILVSLQLRRTALVQHKSVCVALRWQCKAGMLEHLADLCIMFTSWQLLRVRDASSGMTHNVVLHWHASRPPADCWMRA